eukprot:1137222-Pelagomonas_calceolata.AAC.11
MRCTGTMLLPVCLPPDYLSCQKATAPNQADKTMPFISKSHCCFGPLERKRNGLAGRKDDCKVQSD